MSRHYYLLASLPLLDPGRDKLVDLQDFDQACARWLGPDELTLLSKAVFPWSEPVHQGGILGEWCDWERALRNALAEARCKNRGIDQGSHTRKPTRDESVPAGTGAQDIAFAAVQAPDPLKAEEVLFKGRWNKLDELERGHFFDFEQVLVYRIRLMLLSAWKSMSPEAGRVAFDALHQRLCSTFPPNLDL